MLAAKICLTGGPCGGKSTALAKIERKLTDMGYKVLIINEVPTRIVNSGIKPFGDDSINMLEFEEIMLKEQLTEEECYEKAAELINKKCVILCDRGVFDIKSFINNEEFDYLLNKYNLSRLELMDSYNLVINLDTVAKGAEEFYTVENNTARSEGIKDAVIRDDKCQEAWSPHSNFKVVDNSTNFDEKIKRVIDIVKNYLGIEKRNSKKYLVNVKDNTMDILNEKEISCVQINQIYLSTDKECEMRLRKRTLNNDSTYYITVKKNNYGKERIITEEKIDKKTYERLLGQKEVINAVNKERISFTYNDNVYKLDHFEDDTYILEAPLNALIPPFIDLIKDVTLDDNYYNININSSCVTKIKKN